MRHALGAYQNGTAHRIQVLLFVLLQVLLCHGRIIYHRTVKRSPNILQTLRPAQKDQETTSPSGRPTDLMPHIKELGFFPRGDVIQTPDDIRHMLPQIMNRSRVKEIHDAKIWQEFVENALKQNSTTVNRQRAGLTALQLNSSQVGVPHLSRLGFGVGNTDNSMKNNRGTSGHVYTDSETVTKGKGIWYIHRMVVLGIGSFLGGMLVILLLLFLILLQRRRKKKQQQQEQQQHQQRCAEDHQSKRDDPKLALLSHQVSSAMIDETTNELSTSSYSSTSSGGGDSSSHSSDTSISTDLWQSPNHIAMCSPYTEHRSHDSIQTGASAMELLPRRQGSPQSTDMSILDSPNSSPPSNLPFLANDAQTASPINTYNFQHPHAIYINNPMPDVPTSNPPSPLVIIRNRQTESPSYSGGIHERFFNSNIPDLLLQGSHKQALQHTPRSRKSNSNTRPVSKDGGILSCPGGDVVVIIPPGAVHEDHLFQVRLNTDPSVMSAIRGTSAELIISPVVEITVPGAGVFHKAIMIKLPYRALSSYERPFCQDDPLCSSPNSSPELRYWDKSSCTWMPTEWQRAEYGVINHHTWPECFSPEPRPEEHERHRTPARVTFSCFSSTCTIQTNVSGTFCLTSRPQEAERMCCHLLDGIHSNHHNNSLKMCAAVGAKYYLDAMDVDGVRNRTCVTQMNYVLYVSDNTAEGRQQIEDNIQSSGGHRQCVCIPFDLHIGSAVKVTLASISDTDWPWEIPFDCTYKMIQWRELCSDYGTLTRVEFRCLPRNDDMPIAMPTTDDILTTFHLDTTQIGPGVTSSAPHTIIANSGFTG